MTTAFTNLQAAPFFLLFLLENIMKTKSLMPAVVALTLSVSALVALTMSISALSSM
jgi:predicted membrane-bound spermidine synthase